MLFEPEALRVYVVTSSDLVPGRSHLDVARAAVDGGARTVQLRAPSTAQHELRRLASEVASICDGAGALAIVNDRPDVALDAGCGAHVGQDDGVEHAREVLGEEPVLGVSVATPQEAEAAEAAGADYLGVTVWPTSTKPDATAVGLDGLRAIVERTSLPVVGIGGITAGNAWEVLTAGATGIAVVSAVGAAADPVGATRELVRATEDGGRR